MENKLGTGVCAESITKLGAEKFSGIPTPSERPATGTAVGRAKPLRRSAKIILTNEGRVLRQLRLEHGLSMKRAAALIGISDSSVAHVEHGRLNAPKGPRLERFLRVYGDIKVKSFYERVRTFENHPLTPKQELAEILERANDQQTRVILTVAKGLLG